jgi:lycopene beta-cyclase
VVAFGAALGLVQPITGYSVARSLRAVDVVADAIVNGLAAGRAATAIADGAVADVWTSEARMRRRLQLFGLDALCSFDGDDARAFFAAFFAQTPAVWRGFLDGTMSAPDLRRAMWRLFSKVPASVRLRLMRGALSPVAAHVATDALASVVAPVVPHLVNTDAPAFGDPR